MRFGLITLTVLSVIAGTMAMLFAARSARQETEARSGRLASQSDLDRVDLGMLLGVEAYRVDQSAESFGALVNGAERAADLEILLHEHSRPVRSVAFDPDGEILASTGLDGTVVLRSTEEWTATGPPLVPGGGSADVDDLYVVPAFSTSTDQVGSRPVRDSVTSFCGTSRSRRHPRSFRRSRSMTDRRSSPWRSIGPGSTLLAGGEAPGAGSACDR